MDYKILSHSIRNTKLSDGAFRLLVTLIDNRFYKEGSPLNISIDYLVCVTGKTVERLEKLFGELEKQKYILAVIKNNTSKRYTITINQNLSKPKNGIVDAVEIETVYNDNVKKYINTMMICETKEEFDEAKEKLKGTINHYKALVSDTFHKSIVEKINELYKESENQLKRFENEHLYK